MIIPKAIEILSDIILYEAAEPDDPRFAAIKLGIEALQRQKQSKDEIPNELYLPLPSETTEGEK